jgi:hypothetical protein
MADSTVLVLALFFVFTADVFLYYRWKGVKDEYEERQRSRKVDFAKEHLSKWDVGADAARPTPASEVVDGRMAVDARKSKEDLQEILDGDVTRLQGRVSDVNDKLSPS